jgi:hypothetical protein
MFIYTRSGAEGSANIDTKMDNRLTSLTVLLRYRLVLMFVNPVEVQPRSRLGRRSGAPSPSEAILFVHHSFISFYFFLFVKYGPVSPSAFSEQINSPVAISRPITAYCYTTVVNDKVRM